MAGQRIKYIDHKYLKNGRISTRSYKSPNNGANYRIILDLDLMVFYIRNERSKEFIYKSKSYNNLNVLKRRARAKLEVYGIELKTESRDRTFGRCQKGFTQKDYEEKYEI